MVVVVVVGVVVVVVVVVRSSSRSYKDLGVSEFLQLGFEDFGASSALGAVGRPAKRVDLLPGPPQHLKEPLQNPKRIIANLAKEPGFIGLKMG